MLLIHVLFTFLYIVPGRSWASIFCMSIPSCPGSICWKLILSPSNYFVILVKNQLNINLWINFWTQFYFIELCIIFILYNLSYCSFAPFWIWEIWILFVLLQYCLVYSGFLASFFSFYHFCVWETQQCTFNPVWWQVLLPMPFPCKSQILEPGYYLSSDSRSHGSRCHWNWSQ